MAVTLDDVRRICLSLPETEEVFVEAWGHPTFRVRNKMFASMGGEPGDRSVTFKTEGEDTIALAEAGEPWFIPPYVGHRGWRGLHVDHPTAKKVSEAELSELLTISWRKTAPKRLVTAFDAST